MRQQDPVYPPRLLGANRGNGEAPKMNAETTARHNPWRAKRSHVGRSHRSVRSGSFTLWRTLTSLGDGPHERSARLRPLGSQVP